MSSLQSTLGHESRTSTLFSTTKKRPTMLNAVFMSAALRIKADATVPMPLSRIHRIYSMNENGSEGRAVPRPQFCWPSVTLLIASATSQLQLLLVHMCSHGWFGLYTWRLMANSTCRYTSVSKICEGGEQPFRHFRGTLFQSKSGRWSHIF